MRLITSTIKTSFPNISGAMNAKQTEMNVLGSISATTAELDILDGLTSTAAELNILYGVSSTAAELYILDGVTSTTAELNHMGGVISNEQIQIDNVGGGLLDYETHTSSGSIAVPSDWSELVIKASGGFGGSGGRCQQPWTHRCPRRHRIPVHHLS